MPIHKATNTVPTMDWTESGARALICGGLAAAGSYMIYGERGTSYTMGFNIPNAALIGGTVAVSSLGTDMATNYILPDIPGNQKYSTIEGTALAIAASGGITMLGMSYGLSANRESTGQQILLGAGSYILGDYITDNFLYPKGADFTLF